MGGNKGAGTQTSPSPGPDPGGMGAAIPALPFVSSPVEVVPAAVPAPAPALCADGDGSCWPVSAADSAHAGLLARAGRGKG